MKFQKLYFEIPVSPKYKPSGSTFLLGFEAPDR